MEKVVQRVKYVDFHVLTKGFTWTHTLSVQHTIVPVSWTSTLSAAVALCGCSSHLCLGSCCCHVSPQPAPCLPSPSSLNCQAIYVLSFDNLASNTFSQKFFFPPHDYYAGGKKRSSWHCNGRLELEHRLMEGNVSPWIKHIHSKEDYSNIDLNMSD